MLATSKWLDKPTGQSIWQPCTVLNYDWETQLYLIQWHCNDCTKMVTRLNLFFEGEERRRLDFRTEKAEAMRNEVESEMRVRFHFPTRAYARAGIGLQTHAAASCV